MFQRASSPDLHIGRLSHVSLRGCFAIAFYSERSSIVTFGSHSCRIPSFVSKLLSKSLVPNIQVQRPTKQWISILSLIFLPPFSKTLNHSCFWIACQVSHTLRACVCEVTFLCSVAQVVCHNIELFHHNIYIFACCSITCDNGSYIYRVEVSKYSLGKCVCNKLFRIWCTC